MTITAIFKIIKKALEVTGKVVDLVRSKTTKPGLPWKDVQKQQSDAAKSVAAAKAAKKP